VWFAFDRAQERVKRLEEEAASMLAGDGFGQPGGTTATASEYQNGSGCLMVQFEEQLPAKDPRSGCDSVTRADRPRLDYGR